MLAENYKKNKAELLTHKHVSSAGSQTRCLINSQNNKNISGQSCQNEETDAKYLDHKPRDTVVVWGHPRQSRDRGLIQTAVIHLLDNGMLV